MKVKLLILYLAMGLIVQKFGGTSVGSVEKIRNVAKIVSSYIKGGDRVVAVVSAMSGETDRLISLFNEAVSSETFGNEKIMAEYDSIISTGEQVTSGILSSILMEMGHSSRSLLSWQFKMRTTSDPSKAKIEAVDSDFIKGLLSGGVFPVVAGFQGISDEDRQTTLGRGGSDTSAIAIAAALGADRCDIFTDVEGVYTSDPRIVKNARILRKVSYEEVLEMAANGAKVLETRSVTIAMRYSVKTRILSTFNPDGLGTILTNYKEVMERRIVTGITADTKSVQVFVIGVKNLPGTAEGVFGCLKEANVFVDIIAQSPASALTDELNDIVFTINQTDLALTKSALEKKREAIGYQNLIFDENVAKISIIGIGMKTHAGVAYTVFRALAAKNINVLTIATSEIRISVVIHSDYAELAVRVLHDAFKLDKSFEDDDAALASELAGRD